MKKQTFVGTVCGKNQGGYWNVKVKGYIYYGVDFGEENNEAIQNGDMIRFEITVDNRGYRTFALLNNISAEKREQLKTEKENIVIMDIHKDTGLVDIYIPSRDEHDSAYASNWLWNNVKIDGLDLNSCSLDDRLLVEIGPNRKYIKLIKDVTKPSEEYTTEIAGRLRKQPNGLFSVVAVVGGKEFYVVDLGAWKEFCQNGDLVTISVQYDKNKNPQKCELVKNHSAEPRIAQNGNQQNQL